MLVPSARRQVHAGREALLQLGARVDVVALAGADPVEREHGRLRARRAGVEQERQRVTALFAGDREPRALQLEHGGAQRRDCARARAARPPTRSVPARRPAPARTRRPPNRRRSRPARCEAHSWRSASIGLSRAALRAGRKPKATPTQAENSEGDQHDLAAASTNGKPERLRPRSTSRRARARCRARRRSRTARPPRPGTAAAPRARARRSPGGCRSRASAR